jgi:uncharacterized protein with HEPN domain
MYGEVPWGSLIGLRNVVVHEYFQLDLENIWKIVKEDLPPLKQILQKILEEHL